MSREQYRSENLSETLRQANARLASQAEQGTILASQWESERLAMRDEIISLTRDKNNELKSVSNDRDIARDQYRKAQVTYIQHCFLL